MFCGKKIKKAVASVMAFFLTFGMLSGTSLKAKAAADENIDLQIGLFYGSTAKESASVSESQGAIYACMKSDGSVNNMWQNPSDTKLTVQRYNQYYVEINSAGWTYADAQYVAKQYANAYPGNVDGNVCVIIVGYASLAAAQVDVASLTQAGYYSFACNPNANMVLVNNANGGAFAFAQTGSHLVVKPINTNEITVEGTTYNGGLVFKRLSTGDMTVINLVNMYDYLASVVGQEMSPAWPAEALKVQAVAAKCYALTSLSRYKSYGFQLDTTTNTQVYMGISKATTTTRAAVAATKGVQVLYNGAVAQTFFFSSDGGKTEDAQYIWSTDVPYLKGKVDPYEDASEASYGTWTVTLTKAEIAAKLKAKDIDLGEITSVKVTERTPVGRVKTLTVTGTAGSQSFSKTACYSTFGLRSSNYDVLNGLEAEAAGTYTVVTSSGQQNISQNNISVVTKDGAENISGTFNVATNSGIVSVIPTVASTVSQTPDSYTFSGGGWGHGIGISQWGAKAMADAGFSYKDIISFYLTGITFSN